MWSNPDTISHETDGQAEAYIYPPPQAAGVARPAASPGNSSTLERLWNPERAASNQAASDEQIRACEARAHQEGHEEGAKQARVEFDKKLVGQRETLAEAIRGFVHEQATYFSRVEAEVVGLALAIARKILHREAQVDPLLLAGVVRVGLDKVAAGTHVRLRVNPDQVAFWQGFFAQQTDLRAVPELMGDATLDPGHCRLETELGSTDLTLEAQLKEIEQGFFDLLAQRPSKPS
jgi:flagellar assembly protein FliH